MSPRPGSRAGRPELIARAALESLRNGLGSRVLLRSCLPKGPGRLAPGLAGAVAHVARTIGLHLRQPRPLATGLHADGRAGGTVQPRRRSQASMCPCGKRRLPQPGPRDSLPVLRKW